MVNSELNNNTVGGVDEPHTARTTLGWRLSFWIAIATVLLIQIGGLSAFLRHHGVFYNTYHEFPLTFLRIGGKVAAALGLRFILSRWIAKSTTSRSLTQGQNIAAQGLETAAIVLVLTLTAYAYSWPKVMVPILNSTLWDVMLAKIDAALCFGVNPN